MPIFNFRLQPIAQVQPWLGPDGPWLSWFGLSMGWYWLSLGGQEVLRVREAPDGEALPYVDYQVVRLWEDVLDLLPASLEPVPEDVAAYLHDIPRWEATVQRASLERAGGDGTRSADAEWDGFGWWHARGLSMAQLVQTPSVHVWRVGESMHIAWASDPEDQALWSPCRGVCMLSLHSFLEEVRAFDRGFLAAMGERVRTLVEAGGMGGVAIDLRHLQREQEERSTWLAGALSSGGPRSPQSTDWAVVRDQLAQVVRERS